MKKYLAMILVFAMTFAMVTGCSNPGETTPTNAPAPTDPAAPEETPAANTELTPTGEETVSDKDTINIAVDREPATLNPGGVMSNVSEIVMMNTMDTLLKFDKTATPQPNLATEWEALDDTTWQFKLREDVYFTNGEHFTAKDVVYSFNRLATTTTGPSALTHIDLTGLEAVDDYTVKIKTTEPYAFLEAQLCQAVMSIVNEKAITDMGEEAHGRAPVGTGAFKVGNWVAGESITLERNDTYWGEAAPLKNIVLKIMTEGTSRTMNLETGDIDLNCRLQVTDIDRVDESEDTYVLAGPQNTLRYICLNTSVEPLNNVNVRKALYHATDTELIRETIYGVKSSEKATGPVPPTFPGKNNDLPEYTYDPEKAKELLAAEGFENGFEVSFIYLANTTNNMFAEMLQAMWAEVGVTLVLQPTESGTLSTMLNAGDYQVGTAATDMKMCDAGEGLYSFFHSSSRGSSTDRTWLNDPEVDAILDKIVTTLDAEERNALVYEAQALIHDLCPMIYICHPWRVYGVRSDVRGLSVLPYDMEDYSKLYFVNED